MVELTRGWSGRWKARRWKSVHSRPRLSSPARIGIIGKDLGHLLKLFFRLQILARLRPRAWGSGRGKEG
jgi:hypothetical protein